MPAAPKSYAPIIRPPFCGPIRRMQTNFAPIWSAICGGPGNSQRNDTLASLMSAAPAPLVSVTDNGLYCPAGGFHIDPWRPVETAVITHAHGDHLRHGSTRYLLADAGSAVARHRLGVDHDPVALKYGERRQL